MDAPSIPRVARPAGRRVAAPVVAVATQRPAPATAPPAPAADQDGDDPSLDFPAAPDESEALAEAEPVTNPEPEAVVAEPEPQTVAEPIPTTPAPTTPTAVVAPTTAPVATTAATPVPTPASQPASGLRTLVVVRNGVLDYDDSTVQVLDTDNLRGAGAHDLADALLALKGADRSTIKDTAFAELMALFNTAIS